MSFQDDLQKHILLLEQRPDFVKDMALQRVVALFKAVKSQNDLTKQKNLIGRIAVDSIVSWDTIHLIATFMDLHTK